MKQKLLTILGVFFIVLGLIGFFQNPIAGIFRVDIMHNIVHLLSGILGLISICEGQRHSLLFSRTLGILYIFISIIGFVQQDTVLGIIAVNSPDNYLHLGIALTFLAIGFHKTPSTK